MRTFRPRRGNKRFDFLHLFYLLIRFCSRYDSSGGSVPTKPCSENKRDKLPGQAVAHRQSASTGFAVKQNIENMQAGGHKRIDIGVARRAINHSHVTAMRTAIEKRYPDPGLSSDSLWRGSDLSERQMRRMFKEQNGCSIRQYIRDVRISAAQRLLAMSDQSIKMIAGAVGYRHTSYFCEEFRRVVACTPLEYRRDKRTGNCVNGVSAFSVR